MEKSFGEDKGEGVVGKKLIDCIRKQDPIYCCIQGKKKKPSPLEEFTLEWKVGKCMSINGSKSNQL